MTNLKKCVTGVNRTYPRLEEVRRVAEALAVSEHSWRKVQNLDSYDWGSVIVSFSKAVECYLREVLPGLGLQRRRSLGAICEYLKSVPEWSQLYPDASDFNELRIPAAHPSRPDKPMGRRHVEIARNAALRILKNGESIRCC
jgi:hypothetical protein